MKLTELSKTQLNWMKLNNKIDNDMKSFLKEL